MDLTSVRDVKNLLKDRGLAPSRRLGQNFLTDKDAVKKIIDAADIQPNDIVLEIGPGLGVLTQELAQRAKRVIAVEKDQNMVEILKETLSDFKNAEVIREDIRRSDFLSNLSGSRTSKISGNFKVVGNLPFYLTAPVIRQFLERLEARPLTMVFVVQKEVAQRICPACRQAGAKPPKMNLLAVSVQIYAEPGIISYISKNSFWPSPEVDAAILKITPFNPGFPKPRQTPGVDGKTPGVKSVSEINQSLFFRIAKAGFSQPRKQLANNLSSGLKADKAKIGEWLLRNNINPSQRAETLTIDDWLRLAKNYKME